MRLVRTPPHAFVCIFTGGERLFARMAAVQTVYKRKFRFSASVGGGVFAKVQVEVQIGGRCHTSALRVLLVS